MAALQRQNQLRTYAAPIVRLRVAVTSCPHTALLIFIFPIDPTWGAVSIFQWTSRRNYPSKEAYLAFCASACPMFAAGNAFRSEIELVRKDGSHIWVDLSGVIPDRATEESLWAFIDLTERRNFHNRLAQSVQRTRLVLEGASLGTWDLDIPSDKFTQSSRLITMLGYAPDDRDANAKIFVSLLHPDDVSGSASYAHLKGETPNFVVECRMRHKDDHWVWICSRGTVVERDGNDRALRTKGHHNLDISERKRSEVTLVAREAMLATLIASKQGLVFLFDTAGTVVEYLRSPLLPRPAYKPSKLNLGKTYAEILPADVALAFRN